MLEGGPFWGVRVGGLYAICDSAQPSQDYSCECLSSLHPGHHENKN